MYIFTEASEWRVWAASWPESGGQVAHVYTLHCKVMVLSCEPMQYNLLFLMDSTVKKGGSGSRSELFQYPIRIWIWHSGVHLSSREKFEGENYTLAAFLMWWWLWETLVPRLDLSPQSFLPASIPSWRTIFNHLIRPSVRLSVNESFFSFNSSGH